MINIPSYELFEAESKWSLLNESFWLNTIDYEAAHQNGTTWLNVAGVPGHDPARFCQPLDSALRKSNGLVTKEVADLAIQLANRCNRTRTGLAKDVAHDPTDFWLEKRFQKGSPVSKFKRDVSGFDYVEQAYAYPGAFWVARWMSLNVGKTIERGNTGGYLSY